MPFEALADLRPGLDALPCGDATLPERPALALSSFADDVVLPSGRRHAVRVVARGDGSSVRLDLRDSDGLDAEGFGATVDDVQLAATVALAHALGLEPDRRLAEALTVQTHPNSWIGGGPASDPGRR
ncbi:MAG: hypothetical protein AAGA54_32955, partial [Myxococcota bacterium]